jgi:hypothetical protein
VVLWFCGLEFSFPLGTKKKERCFFFRKIIGTDVFGSPQNHKPQNYLDEIDG